MTLVYVALGAALGAPLRYLVAHYLDGGLSGGTVLVNVVGSFLLGLATGLGLGGTAAAFVGTGFCGALTTYSAFAVQTFDHGVRRGVVIVLMTIPPALLACSAGYSLGS